MKFIDLGLPSGTLWADRNLGAKRQHDAGVYMSHPHRLRIENAVLPSNEQFKELLTCPRKWTTRNGQPGYLIKGFNGNSIFLPAVGYYYGPTLYDSGTYGYYWSTTYGSSSYAYSLYFDSSGVNTTYYSRYSGMPIRLVKYK